MLHRALLMSHDSADVFDVLLDVSGTDVEMFVDETSVGKWGVEHFIGEPQENGFQLRVDGERWIVQPRDRLLFEADTVLRTPRTSSARFVNRHKRLGKLISELRRTTTRRLVMWYLVLVAMSVGSFGFGVIVGRYRIDGDNVFTWGLIGVLATISILLGRALVAAASDHRAELGASELAPAAEPQVDAVSRLLSTLQFQAPSTETELQPVVTIDLTAAEGETDTADPDPEALSQDSKLDEMQVESQPDPAPEYDTQIDVRALFDEPAAPGETRPEAAKAAEDSVQRDETDEPLVDRGRVRLPVQTGMTGETSGRKRARRQDSGDRVVILNLESADDLTTIHGIGPAYAAILDEIGIHSYQQLASIDANTLAALRTRLGPLAGRIERDRWIESAAAAYRAKLNERRRDAVSM